ncbi:MAG: ADP-ribosylglycohydrolase family protein [Dongiaceae bacterium]
MTMTATSSRDRAIGALLGLAVGDAVGTTLEFSERDWQPPLLDMIGGGPFGLRPGVWTDDTSMALCLADSLLAADGLDRLDLMRRFLGWMERGENTVDGRCFDIGMATRAALSRFCDSGDPIAGSRDPMSAGNGSLMRLAPVAIRWHRDAARAVLEARRQSETTHAAAAALDACAYFANLLVQAIGGGSRTEVLQPIDLEGDPAVRQVASGSWLGKSRGRIESSGYVVHTLEAALWSVAGAASFEDAVLRAANLADDADTVAAVAGQLAGALWGVSGIPPHWRDRLAWRDDIEARAAALFDKGLA